jgi:hypothetical protein
MSGVPADTGSGSTTGRQVSLLQQSLGSRLGKDAQVMLWAGQALHWPPWQIWPSGQQIGGWVAGWSGLNAGMQT